MFDKYRVVLHPDKDGFPNHWLIQKKKPFGKWKFYSGYFQTKSEAENEMKNNVGPIMTGAQKWT